MISKQLSTRVGVVFGVIYSVAVLFFLYHLYLSHFELVRDESLSKIGFIESKHYAVLGIQTQNLEKEQAQKIIQSGAISRVKDSLGHYQIQGVQFQNMTAYGVIIESETGFRWVYQSHKSLLGHVFSRFLKTSGLYIVGMALLGFGMLFLIHRFSVTHVNQIIAEEEEKDRKSNFDPLTQLKNRVQILRDLNTLIESSLDNKEKFALVIFDVDNFERINTQYGQDRADKILKYLSMRVSNTITKKDEFARTGGDEFMLLIKSYRGYQQSSMVVDRVLNVVNQSNFNLDKESIAVSLSAGLAFFTQDGKDSETLIEAATQALQHAKADGKSCFRTFDPKINRLVQEKVQIEHRLKQALSKDEFTIFYQGVHEPDSTLVGVEALLRWNLDGEILEPHKFLPMASNGQLIVSIGYWVIEECFKQMSTWLQAGKQPIPIHINLNGVQVQDEHLVSIFEVLFEKYKVKPSLVRLDIKEVDLYDRRIVSVRCLNRLSKLGLKIWIDDMGTGYSSFNTLANLEFEGIKIDGFLTSDVLIEEKARKTIESIIGFAKIHDWNVVAESLESQDQANWYMSRTEVQFQGFHYSVPMPAEEFTKKYLN